MLTVILGGARSGKSTYAETLAREAAGKAESVFYLATAEPGDEEMAARIAEHRARRPDHWRTIEAPLALADAVKRTDVPVGSVVLVDCVTLLASNIITSEPAPDADRADEALFAELKALLAVACERTLRLLLVSNEVGWGIVPMHPLGRQYRDLVGRANRWLAARADRAYLVVAGYALDLKALGKEIGVDAVKTEGTEGTKGN